MNHVRILGFVNHIPPGAGIEESIERAFDWGVDVMTSGNLRRVVAGEDIGTLVGAE